MSGRLAVVTGASGGIGGACVRKLQQTGFHVIGVDKSESSEADEHVVIDLAGRRCGEALSEVLGGRPVQGLLNNAAAALYTTMEETSVEAWDAVLDTNLRSAFLISRSLIPNLAAGGGSVVNVVSVHAIATSVGIAAYAASKGGLLSLTRAMALELADRGVRVNAVLPGAVSTPMLEKGLSRSGVTVSQLGESHPLGRVAEPREIADAIVFLLGDGASYITGAGLTVDGGSLAHLSTE